MPGMEKAIWYGAWYIELQKGTSAISDVELLRAFLRHSFCARCLMSHLYIHTWAGAIFPPMFQVQRWRQGDVVPTPAPTLAPSKDTRLHASLSLLGCLWEVGQPQMPGSSPHWSFLYSHHGLSVSVALMRRPKCGVNVFIQSHKQPPTSVWGWNLSLSLASKDHCWVWGCLPALRWRRKRKREGGSEGLEGVGGRQKNLEREEERRRQRSPAGTQAGVARHLDQFQIKFRGRKPLAQSINLLSTS